MFGSEIFEVGIGLALIYLLMSLICTVLIEWTASILALRADTLESGIRKLLNGSRAKPQPGGANVGEAGALTPNDLAATLYNHPLIQGLARKTFIDQISPRRRASYARPSYIPSRVFSVVLLDSLAKLADKNGTIPVNPKALLSDPRIDEVLRSYVNYDDIKRMLSLLLVEFNLEQTKENIEQWFDDAMERVSGWYTRRTQIRAVAFAVGISVFFNVDTLAIGRTLWSDDAVRAATAIAAQNLIESSENDIQRICPTASPTPSASIAIDKRLGCLQDTVRGVNLPLGWNPLVQDPDAPDMEWTQKYIGKDWRAWVSKVAGLSISTIALALGAPFWFDTLNKLVHLRGTGKKPEGEPQG
jgi:hypothetical protein